MLTSTCKVLLLEKYFTLQSRKAIIHLEYVKLDSIGVSSMEVLVDQKLGNYVDRASAFLNERLPKGSIIAACVIGLLSVSFLWGFWTHGYYALGINATIISLLAIAYVVIYGDSRKNNNLLWVVPSVLISLSFFLYENPFIKCINLVAFPFFMCFFLWISKVDPEGKLIWRFSLIEDAVMSLNHYLTASIPGSLKYLYKVALAKMKLNPKTFTSVLKGLIPLVLLYLIVIPMLTSADSLFGDKLNDLISYLNIFFDLAPVYRLVVFTIIVTYLVALLPAIDHACDIAIPEPKEKPNRDSISTFIVLSGMLILYCLFIYVQFERFSLRVLPINFAETEYYVKTGFWQLFTISLFNLCLSYFFYGRISLKIKNLLGLFNVTSLLMLLSSAQRLGLYVYFYGFSYEKFYASYTVLYCGILLLVLIYASFAGETKDPLKYGAYLLFYMYAFITVLPVERFIFESNIILSHSSETRINLDEMTMLSVDVYPSVRREAFLLEWDSWRFWEQSLVKHHIAKHFYEMTLSDLLGRDRLVLLKGRKVRSRTS